MGRGEGVSDAMTPKQVTSWAVGIAAGLVAIGSGAKAFWNEVGWVTPSTQLGLVGRQRFS